MGLGFKLFIASMLCHSLTGFVLVLGIRAHQFQRSIIDGLAPIPQMALFGIFKSPNKRRYALCPSMCPPRLVDFYQVCLAHTPFDKLYYNPRESSQSILFR
jgi:hypothetical protein